MARFIRSPIFLITLFVLALVIRLYQIGSLSNNFHLIRQYATAMMVRPDFLVTQADTSPWRLDIARLNQQPMLEPPVIQQIALLMYRIAGREDLALPRAVSAVSWVIGGYFIYLLGKKLYSHEAALIATAFYLFAPFGILASRSFQANPMMVALTVISLYAILRYFENPTPRRFALAILASASAILLMIFAAFTIFLVYYGLAVYTFGWRKGTFNRQTLIFGFLSLLPAALYYFYGLYIAGFLASQTGSRLIPSLWFSAGYWINWVNQILGVIGVIPLVLSIQALVTVRRSKQAALLRSLWVSYLVFGLFFNYHIMSHSYYSLILIPIVALSMGAIIQQIFAFVPTARRQAIEFTALAGTVVIVLVGLVNYLPTTVVSADQLQTVQDAYEVGETLNHTSEAIILSADEGATLQYFGEIAGTRWPNFAELNVEKLDKKVPLTAQERMEGLLAGHVYRYFVSTSMEEFENQTDLVQYLNTHYPVLAKTDTYVVYRLDEPLKT